MRSRILVPAAAIVLAAASPAQSFVNFESGPVHPIRISADGSRLFVADTVGGHLCVFDLADPAAPFLVAEIPVGLDPVSVNPRTRDEVWVTNVLSDSVSIVSVPDRRVVATIRVADEPSDVVFAGGKAFVSAATTDEVEVFDAVTRASLGTVPVFGKDPRALAVSHDGSRVYAVIQRSGNGTTILPHGTQAPPAPIGPLPPAPAQGILVRADDPAWAAQIAFTLPDHDVAEIDVATHAVLRYFDAVGTTNTAIAVHPTSGDLWVVNTEARNLTRFEPNLRGHAIDSRVTRITTGATPTVTPFDLNPGISYTQLPNPTALATALSEPFGVAIDAAAGRVYVAAHGSDRIGVLDLAGNVVARIEASGSSAPVPTRQKRGPRGLALHPTQPRLYVLNRLTDTLAVVDTIAQTVLSERAVTTWDAMPQLMREGRKFLYDAKLSGNGTMSCAACHIDGDTDGLAWDLGDPAGVLDPVPPQPLAPFPSGFTAFHPMKGPMTTQTLRGMAGTGPLHWRGDRADFQAFNGAFDHLLGGTMIPQADMDDYATFAMAIRMPPNPNQALDRTLRTTPSHNNEAAGLAAFQQQIGALSCAGCHALPLGTDTFIYPAAFLQEPQHMKVPQLRNLYRKVGFGRDPGPKKSGFGFMHDGAVDTLTNFLLKPIFNVWPASTKDDIETFLMSFDTGTAPAVGFQIVANQATATTQQLIDDVLLAASRAAAGDLDLVAHGVIDGRIAGLKYEPAQSHFTADRTGDGPYTGLDLLNRLLAGTASLVLTAVPPGSGERLALDRDGDSTWNGDEDGDPYGVPSPGCAGEARLWTNSEARQGNTAFGFVVENAPPGSAGVMWVGLAPASTPVFGVTLLVDTTTALWVPTASDAHGSFTFGWPTSWATTPGVPIYVQSTWVDACGSQGWSASRGLSFTFRP